MVPLARMMRVTRAAQCAKEREVAEYEALVVDKEKEKGLPRIPDSDDDSDTPPRHTDSSRQPRYGKG